MLRFLSRAAYALAAAALCAGPAAALQDGALSAGYLSITQDVPCPPVTRHVRAKRRRVVHRVPVRRVVHKPIIHKRLVRHIVRRHRPHVVHASAPVNARRCTVIRREPLTAASFGYAPDVALLQPASYDIEPGGPVASIAPTDGTGTPAIGPPPGGGTGGPGGSGGTMVSAAPEPSTWALLMLGVAAAGMMLRRRRDEAQAGIVAGS